MPETTSKTRQKAPKRADLPKAKGNVPAPAKKAKIGAPSKFNQETADFICVMLSEGMSLRKILKEDTEKLLPSQGTIYNWLLKNPDFLKQYTRAREEQAETLADEIIDIADEQPEIVDVVDKRTGELIEHKLDGAFLQWQKNRIEARKWTASKLRPKKYGDRVAVEGVEGGAPIATEDANASRLFEVIKNMEMSKRAG